VALPDEGPGLSSKVKSEKAKAASRREPVVFPLEIKGGFFESDGARDFVGGFLAKSVSSLFSHHPFIFPELNFLIIQFRIDSLQRSIRTDLPSSPPTHPSVPSLSTPTLHILRELERRRSESMETNGSRISTGWIGRTT
jgi:hypothetical protein